MPFRPDRAHARPAVPATPALPPGWQRDPFIHLVERVARHLGVGSAAIHTWARLAAMTRPCDWTAGEREPFVYAAASEVAKILGLSEARLRAHTVELERAGLLERRTAANGSRSLHAGTGLYFSCVIARLPDLAALDAQLSEDRHRAMYLRGQRSTHRRCLRKALDALCRIAPQDRRVLAIAAAFALWPRADRLHAMPLVALVAHEAEADALTRAALDLLDVLEEMHDQPRKTERSHKQDTNEDLSVFCKAVGDPQSVSRSTASDGAGHEAESPRGKAAGKDGTEWLAKLGPERLFRLASPEMQFYLSARAEPERLRLHDILWTVERRLPELDIHPSAWAEACAKMGVERATVAMLILDARRTDPRAPVFSAGGYLRGMTRAWQLGQLNLMGSLIGLSERRRREQVS